MKRFWFIIATAGLIAGMTAEAAPFYRVQCYDSNDKLVDCDDVAKAQKQVARKHTKKIVKAKKVNTLAEKEAREKAILLRQIAKQNEELKAEMQALRKANLLAAAKKEETPAPTAQLAATTTVQLPAAAPISTTQVAKEPVEETKSPWGFGAMNWMFLSAKEQSPLENELDLSVTYNFSPDYSFTIEDDPTWNWTNPKNTAGGGFKIGGIQPIFSFNNLYTSPSKQTTLTGDINGFIGISEESRDANMLFSARFRVKLKTKVNDGKGWFRFDTFVTPSIHRYTTSAPTGNTKEPYITSDGGSMYEKLEPYDRVATGVKLWFHHKIVGGLDFETSVQFRGKYTYADEIDTGNGNIETITPASWVGDVSLDFPRISYTVNDSLSFDGAVSSTGPVQKFRPFNIADGNNMKFVFRITYEI